MSGNLSGDEPSAQHRDRLVQLGIWVGLCAFGLGVALGFALCWMFFVTGSRHKLIDVGSTDPPSRVSRGGSLTLSSPEVAGQMTGFRNRVGQSMLFKVTGIASGATIWGTDLYTDDSPLPITAVHFGALKPGETGIIRVTLLPGRDSYDGSVRNGVTSAPYAKWEGSYRLERVTGPTTEPVLDLPVNRASQPQLLLDNTTPATRPARPRLSVTRPF